MLYTADVITLPHVVNELKLYHDFIPLRVITIIIVIIIIKNAYHVIIECPQSEEQNARIISRIDPPIYIIR